MLGEGNAHGCEVCCRKFFVWVMRRAGTFSTATKCVATRLHLNSYLVTLLQHRMVSADKSGIVISVDVAVSCSRC